MVISVRAGSSDLAVTYLRKGDYAGEAALLLDEAWPFTLQALEHVEIVRIGKDDFKALSARYPHLEESLWAEMVARLKLRGAAVRSPVSSEYLQMAMDTGLIHGESVLLIDLSTCTRCDECVRGCADAHGGEPRFIREGQKYRHWLVPTASRSTSPPASAAATAPIGARGTTSSWWSAERSGPTASRWSWLPNATSASSVPRAPRACRCVPTAPRSGSPSRIWSG